jgi:hypothetical protein
MSETRRLARALVEPEAVVMESHHSRAESIERLREAARAFTVTADGESVAIAAHHASFVGRWQGGAEDLKLVGELRPAPRNRITLTMISLTLVAIGLLAAGAWVFDVPTPQRYLMTMMFTLSVLFMPYFIVGIGSSGEADRARIRKALRVALQDEEERLPAKKWDDE